MWQPSDWIALGALIVAAVSSAAAIVSVAYTWWDRRQSRPDPFRAAVYAEQVRVASDLVRVVRRAHEAVLDPESSDAEFDEAHDRVAEFVAITPHVPLRMVKATHGWLTASAAAIMADADTFERAFSGQGLGEGGDAPVPSRREAMEEAWDTFIGRIRHELGVGRLHDEVREVIGVTAAERLARDRAQRLESLQAALDVYQDRLEGRPRSEE